MAADLLAEHFVEPGTGKALPVLRGQVIRVEQIEGGQCVDFNAFNLHDYKERLDAGRTRYFQSPNPSVGDHLWSAPPRDRVILTIIGDTGGGNDITFQRCSGALFEYQAGFASHTNCQDIQAEAIREYGLTPDDVHDPLNMFIRSLVDSEGRLLNQELGYVGANPSAKGSYVEMLAQIDVLAVPNICGSDNSPTSNFQLNPVNVSVRAASESERNRWLLPQRQFANQRGPDTFKVSQIRATRELVRDSSYVPDFDTSRIQSKVIDVSLDDEQHIALQLMLETGVFGHTESDVLKRVFFAWWVENKRLGPRVDLDHLLGTK